MSAFHNHSKVYADVLASSRPVRTSMRTRSRFAALLATVLAVIALAALQSRRDAASGTLSHDTQVGHSTSDVAQNSVHSISSRFLGSNTEKHMQMPPRDESASAYMKDVAADEPVQDRSEESVSEANYASNPSRNYSVPAKIKHTADRSNSTMPAHPARHLPKTCHDPQTDTLILIPIIRDTSRTRTARAALRATWADPEVLRAHHKMAASYRAIAELAPKNIKWVFKTDSDTLVFPSSLRRLLNLHASNPNRLVMGHKYPTNRVLRTGPWANTVYESDFYPAYMAGAGFVISRDLIDWIADQAANGWLRIMPNEDAMLGVWLAALNTRLIGYNRRFLPLLAQHGRKHTAVPSRICPVILKIESQARSHGSEIRSESAEAADIRSVGMVLLHNLTPNAIQDAWSKWISCGNPCACDKAVEQAHTETPKSKVAAAMEGQKRKSN